MLRVLFISDYIASLGNDTCLLSAFIRPMVILPDIFLFSLQILLSNKDFYVFMSTHGVEIVCCEIALAKQAVTIIFKTLFKASQEVFFK